MPVRGIFSKNSVKRLLGQNVEPVAVNRPQSALSSHIEVGKACRYFELTVATGDKSLAKLPATTVVDPGESDRQCASLSQTFNEEIDAWARMAMARNGFGDLPG